MNVIHDAGVIPEDWVTRALNNEAERSVTYDPECFPRTLTDAERAELAAEGFVFNVNHKPEPITEGCWVRFTGHYDWHGKDKHGMTGIVKTLTACPPQVLAGVTEYIGRLGSGEQVFGFPVPLFTEELEVIAPPR